MPFESSVHVRGYGKSKLCWLTVFIVQLISWHHKPTNVANRPGFSGQKLDVNMVSFSLVVRLPGMVNFWKTKFAGSICSLLLKITISTSQKFGIAVFHRIFKHNQWHFSEWLMENRMTQRREIFMKVWVIHWQFNFVYVVPQSLILIIVQCDITNPQSLGTGLGICI